MKIISIDYKKHYSEDGCVYKQLITIDKELKEKYNDMLKLEKNRIEYRKNRDKTITNRDMNILSYTKNLDDGINYIKNTGLLLFIYNYHSLDEKNRLFNDRNTIIKVI